MNKLLEFLFLIYFLNFTQNCFSENIFLPALLKVEMLKGLYSERSEIGDKMKVKLLEPINLPNERIFIPINSIIEGKITQIAEAEMGLRNGQAQVVFERVYYPNGYFMDLEAYLVEKNYQISEKNETNTEIKGKTSLKQKLFKIGKIGTGAFFGGPVGAIIATGTLIFDKGGKVRIPEGEIVQIRLNAVKLPNNYNVKGKITDIYSPL